MRKKGIPNIRISEETQNCEEICKFYKEDYDLDIKDEEVFVSTSGCLAMYLVMETILDDGDEVIIPSPYFTPYYQQIELARGIPVELDTYEEEDYQFNVERLESLITERTKAIVINSPSNPTGNCLTLETMKKIAEVAEKYDLVVVSDEIYTAYSFQNPFIPFRSIPGMAERTLDQQLFQEFCHDRLEDRLHHCTAAFYQCYPTDQRKSGIYRTIHFSESRLFMHSATGNRFSPALVETFRERMYYAAERINKIPNMHVLYPPKGSFICL